MGPEVISVRDRNNNPLSDQWCRTSHNVPFHHSNSISTSNSNTIDDDEFQDAKEDFYDM